MKTPIKSTLLIIGLLPFLITLGAVRMARASGLGSSVGNGGGAYQEAFAMFTQEIPQTIEQCLLAPSCAGNSENRKLLEDWKLHFEAWRLGVDVEWISAPGGFTQQLIPSLGSRACAWQEITGLSPRLVINTDYFAQTALTFNQVQRDALACYGQFFIPALQLAPWLDRVDNFLRQQMITVDLGFSGHPEISFFASPGSALLTDESGDFSIYGHLGQLGLCPPGVNPTQVVVVDAAWTDWTAQYELAMDVSLRCGTQPANGRVLMTFGIQSGRIDTSTIRLGYFPAQ